MASKKLKIDIEYLLPLLDLFLSLVTRAARLYHRFGDVDLATYAAQSWIYMTKTNDYSDLWGETGSTQYPAASLYLYSFFNWLTNFKDSKDFEYY